MAISGRSHHRCKKGDSFLKGIFTSWGAGRNFWRGQDSIKKKTRRNGAQRAQISKKEILKIYTNGVKHSSVSRHFLQDADVKHCTAVHTRQNVLLNDAVASSSCHITKKLCSWNWKYFFRISDPDLGPDHVQNLTSSFQCHLTCCQMLWRLVH